MWSWTARGRVSVSDSFERRPVAWDPLTSPLEECDFRTRHHGDPLSTADLAAAYARSKRGTLYVRRETLRRRIVRGIRRIVT